jgi:hypothetical protein
MSMQVEPLLRTERGEVWFGWVARPFTLLSPFGGEDFALMLHVAGEDVTPDEQQELSAAIVAAGCRYAICSGHEATTWDDSLDYALLETDADLDPPDEDFVMTGWSEDADLEEAAWSLLWASDYEGFTARRYLALVVGGGELDRRALEAALRAAAAEGGPPRREEPR